MRKRLEVYGAMALLLLAFTIVSACGRDAGVNASGDAAEAISEASGNAIPIADYKNYDPYRGGGLCLMLRSDVAEALELTDLTLNNWDEVGDVLRTIKDAYPEYTPVMSGYDGAIVRFLGNASEGNYYDPLGNMYGILEHPLESTTVTDYYASDGFREVCEHVYQWRRRGLVDKNAILKTYDLVKEGYSVGFFTEANPNSAEVATANCGVEMSQINLFPEMVIINNDGIESLAYGFEFDDSNVLTEVAACNDAVDLYRDALLSGGLNPDTQLGLFLEALKEAGEDRIITAKQRQLNAWKRHLK